jgi:hypothetical protein
MGNIYTHINKIKNHKLSLMSELRGLLFVKPKTPNDLKRIQEIKNELKNKNLSPIKHIQRKKYIGIFN